MSPKVQLTPKVLAAVQRSMDAVGKLKRDALAVAWWFDANFSEQITPFDVLKHAATEDDAISYVSLQFVDPSFSPRAHGIADGRAPLLPRAVDRTSRRCPPGRMPDL